MRRFFGALLLFVSASAFAAETSTESDRLLATGKLWFTIKYFHPYLAYQDIDWDKALVDALPAIRAAKTAAEYSAALHSMLEALHDPASHIASENKTQRDSHESETSGQRTWVHDSFHSAFYTKAGTTESATLVMGEGVNATIRLSEPVPAADSRPAYPAPKSERAYNESQYPSTELRILAAYKIWGMVHYFFAYRDLMDEDWDDLLPAFLPKFIAAKDGREYNLVVAEMVSHMADSHAIVESEALTSFFGKAPVGLRLRLIERKPLVTEILDEDAKQAGVQVGDIVSKVDGESLVDRFRRETPYMAASTQQSLGNLVIERILNGPEDSTSTLTITDREGRTHEVHLKRSSRYFAALRNQRTGEIIKRLATNVGYADLDRLMPDQVDSMFEQLRDTKAILFDMRGCPHESMATLASRLTDEHEVPTAIFTGPLALSPDISTGRTLTSTASYFFVEKLPESALWKYKGKTAMLIDERTIGEAEHTGLFLEVANKTAFVGSASAGADGEVTRFVVPGGITIHFSGRDVRHANGGKLQRLGLQPNVNVTPTIQGIRSGRDEVLEKAVEYVSK